LDRDTSLSIGKTATGTRTGLSQDTLRSCERIGPHTGVPEDAGGHRRYSRKNLSTRGFTKRTQAPIIGNHKLTGFRQAHRKTLDDREASV